MGDGEGFVGAKRPYLIMSNGSLVHGDTIGDFPQTKQSPATFAWPFGSDDLGKPEGQTAQALNEVRQGIESSFGQREKDRIRNHKSTNQHALST